MATKCPECNTTTIERDDECVACGADLATNNESVLETRTLAETGLVDDDEQSLWGDGGRNAEVDVVSDTLPAVAPRIVARSENVTRDEIELAWQYCWPAAAALGYDPAGVLTDIGILASAGVRGRSAGSKLRSHYHPLGRSTSVERVLATHRDRRKELRERLKDV